MRCKGSLKVICRTKKAASLACLLLALHLTIGEARISEAGSDREYAPAFDVAHVGDLAEALRNGVVMYDDSRLLIAYPRHQLVQARGQIEFAAFPVAWEILRATIDGTVRLDFSRASNPEERRKLHLFLLRR